MFKVVLRNPVAVYRNVCIYHLYITKSGQNSLTERYVNGNLTNNPYATVEHTITLLISLLCRLHSSVLASQVVLV